MGLFEDVLDFVDQKKRLVKRNMGDIVSNPRQYLEQWNDQAKNYNRNVEPTIQGGLLTNRPLTQSEVEAKHRQMAMDVAQFPAITAWHGSPHKFDKFSLDKIGTGEGAQAYGHGLYLAERPEVAQSYKRPLASEFFWRDLDDALPNDLKGKAPDWTDALLSGKTIDDLADTLKYQWQKSSLQRSKEKIQSVIEKHTQQGHLYKTDIPDEAVARFLDWDKPLSQQAPDVQAALQKAAEIRAKQTGGAFGPLDMSQVGRDVVPSLGEGRLKQSGIPGIRYLDGGSRSAGQGSSNFVVFDPELIRILERNGVPTGQKPWKSKELDILKDTTDEQLFVDTTR